MPAIARARRNIRMVDGRIDRDERVELQRENAPDTETVAADRRDSELALLRITNETTLESGWTLTSHALATLRSPPATVTGIADGVAPTYWPLDTRLLSRGSGPAVAVVSSDLTRRKTQSVPLMGFPLAAEDPSEQRVRDAVCTGFFKN